MVCTVQIVEKESFKGIRIPKSNKCLREGIPGIAAHGIAILLKTGIQNPSLTDNDWNPVPGNPESTVWNPESKTVLNSYTWGDQEANGERTQT